MSTQGLGYKSPVNRSSSTPASVGAAATVLFATVSMSGVVPTSTQLSNAIKAAFEAVPVQPKQGDVVVLTVTGSAIFSASVTAPSASAPASFWFCEFTVELAPEPPVSWAAIINQHGLA